MPLNPRTLPAFTADLPWPPTVNHYWKRNGHQQFLSGKGRRFRKDVIAALAYLSPPQFRGRLAVLIHAHPPDRRLRDLDNLLKPLLDALRHGLAYEDDGLIDHLTIIRGDPHPGGRVIVTIRELP